MSYRQASPIRRAKLTLALIFLCSINANAEIEEVKVIATTPNQGVGLERDKIPYNIQSAGAEDLERAQSLDISDYLNRNMAGITINSAANNPLQQDVQFRGYSASPLLGLAQGIAVYQNGIRINEPLGDSVNWDLLPESAIHSIGLIGGANPLFGLNTLGGALSVSMKDGFNSEGHNLRLSGGSFERIRVSAESGGNNGSWRYYGNVSYFEEDGWRDESPSDAINFYGSVGWRSELTSLNLNYQHGDSELIGNGAIPIELLDVDRDAIFTAPDRTENNMHMISADISHEFSETLQFGANAFYRRNKTDSFNGDGTEFAICNLGGTDILLEGLEEDDLEDIGLDDDDVCDNQFANADALETFLNATALAAGEDEEFNLEDLSGELEGTGVLSDQAINNISDRTQKSYGSDLQMTFLNDLFGHNNQLIVGFAWFKGKSSFNSVLELANLDPITRSTQGLGTGTFVEEGETDINTSNETLSFYFSNTYDLNEQLSFSFSGRINNTQIELADQSGERPELNGEHDFFRFNPAVGLTYKRNQNSSFYAGYNESSRAPTPIELACNDSVFNLAVAAAIADGEDPDDVEFECRLPNAFLADPPLEQVVTRSFELGTRGKFNEVEYHLGFFHSVNEDDILFQTTGRSTGLFANVDETKRLGLESSFNGSLGKAEWFLTYSYLEATFEDNFAVLSPNHPFADDEGELNVTAGDRIPGLPEHNLKLGADYYFNDKFSLGFDVRYNSDQVLRGDESNQLESLDGYAIVNIRGRYRMNEMIEFFARVDNLFDTDYENFGLLGEEPSEVDVPLFENFSNPRFLGPGAPLAGFVGVKLSL
ncbi:MAG: TonB-dependent receptor plug domain-containing protein [Gammaproteobacteria bacterium]|nr:TonB-dependent receptor plug domain-containing protein [Gammaproteobacteria bacterium]